MASIVQVAMLQALGQTPTNNSVINSSQQTFRRYNKKILYKHFKPQNKRSFIPRTSRQYQSYQRKYVK